MKSKEIVALFIIVIVVSSVVIGTAVTLGTRAKSGGTSGGSSVIIEIRNFAFKPQNISIPANTVVKWINNDSMAHTATSLTGAPQAFDSGTISPGGSFTHTFTVAGVYPYYCTIHPFMRGNVSVGAGVQGSSVEIKEFAFTPANITVPLGTTVTWFNNDTVAHTATSLSGAPVAFDSGTLNPGSKYTFTFTQAGTYPYHCSIHPFMLGTVTVTP